MAKWLIVALALGAAACGTLERPGGERGAQTSRADAAPAGAASLTPYLELMQRLIEGDALMQAAAFREAADAADFAPTTTNRLKYALALAMPGHPGSDAVLAEQRLSALLSASGLLPEERVLATIHLRDVEQRLILDAAAEQLRRESTAAIEQRNADSARRLETALEENRRLRAALEDATKKLNALSTIEQAIRERDNGSN